MVQILIVIALILLTTQTLVIGYRAAHQATWTSPARFLHRSTTTDRMLRKGTLLYASSVSSDNDFNVSNITLSSTIISTNSTTGIVSDSTTNSNEEGKEIILNILNAALIGYFATVIGEIAWKVLKARKFL